MDENVRKERERCANAAASLAERWEASAAKLREKKVRMFFVGPKVTAFKSEQDARTIDAAARGVRAVEKVIREGKVPSP